jgi:redox-sensitive bicupin YhaK (pirin superfamily)
MDEQPESALTVHRAAERYESAPEPGVATRHAFSFSGHYDPANTHFGALLACNEEVLGPGAGFAPHRHRDTEILTWVLEGTLRHEDDRGHSALVRPGQLQHLSAGGGVTHSESNPAAEGRVRFIQFWLQPDVFGAEPEYGTAEAPPLTPGRRRDATLHLLRADPGRPLALPAAPYRYLHLLRGGLGFRSRSGPRGVGQELAPGDSVRIAGAAEPVDLTAGPQGAELLLLAMGSALRYG